MSLSNGALHQQTTLAFSMFFILYDTYFVGMYTRIYSNEQYRGAWHKTEVWRIIQHNL